jgi:predicted component of type VI protein secretion system
VSPVRRCSRTACPRPAIATLTYVYGDQTAVLGPLATYAEPHAYDLCDEHSERLSAPRGWEVLRLAPDPAALGPSSDDLLALADAVREAARPTVPAQPTAPTGRETGRETVREAGRETGRRGHLRVLRPVDD